MSHGCDDMHPCLKIQDITVSIAGFLSKGDLTRLGIVCRQFYEPAMDALWSDLRGMAALIMCLPADGWELDPTSLGPGDVGWVFGSARISPGYTMTRKVEKSEWERFRFHARRVRSIRIAGEEFPGQPMLPIKLSCWAAIAEAFQGERVLPNLRSLCWHGQVEIDLAKLFLQPSLQTVILDCPFYELRDVDEEHFALVIDALKDKTPFLKKLNIAVMISREAKSPGILNSLKATIPSLTYLATVQAGCPILPRTVVDLASLPSLHTLYFDLQNYGRTPSSIKLYSIMGAGFRSLQSLELRSCAVRLDPLLAFLGTVRSPLLRKVYFTLDFYHDDPPLAADGSEIRWEQCQPTAAKIRTILVALAKFPSLTHLNIASDPDCNDSPEPQFVLGDDDLAELLGLKELQECNLASFPIVISAAFIGRMATSWENMEALQLGVDCLAEGITFQHLSSFATFPNLTRLAIPIQSLLDGIPDPASYRTEKPSPRVKELDVGQSSLEHDVEPLAAYLAHMFPLAVVTHRCRLPEASTHFERLNAAKKTIVEAKANEGTFKLGAAANEASDS